MAEQSCKQASRRESTDNSSQELVKKPKLINETKITDLNYDCLYSIFKWMSIHDTIQMCGISKKFVEPAIWIMKVFNRQHTFSINYMPSCRIKFIGQALSKILLDYAGTFENRISVVQDSILEYCTELTELTLVNAKSAPFESINTPIAKLKVLHLDNCILGPVFCQFSKWLPQLRTLTVINCKVIDESCIGNMATTMPALESMHIDVVQKIKLNADDSFERFARCNTDVIIKRNGHIKCFRTTSEMKPRRLLNISKSMERLETLEFQAVKRHFKGSSYKSINFKWVKTLILTISGCESCHCPLVFDYLEELNITCNTFADSWTFFARTNRIKKLKLYWIGSRPNLSLLMSISSTWPDLIEVSMHLNCVPSDDVIKFIHSLGNLRRFNFLKYVCQYPSKWEFTKFEEVKHHLSDKFEIIPGTDEIRFSLVRLN
ncbi:uncharacterized protein LOC119085752 isoform X2 [Bradysia coprophila]|uniref:uncharacterized protein LOC119085752 isoform X2 n=1 Tax=Bradysia coprophila TaxID=38358 RepID=UPI00187D8D52|nr:uncharacterized protein LOC119085752 isoform X2 [Bradysia coprophila]